MGRFDALTQFEELKRPQIPSSVVIPPPNDQRSNTATEQQNEPKKSTKPQNHIPTSPAISFDKTEKPEKYTTHLEPSLVKKLKLHATERDMKDYQVIRNALLLYFEKTEKNK